METVVHRTCLWAGNLSSSSSSSIDYVYIQHYIHITNVHCSNKLLMFSAILNCRTTVITYLSFCFIHTVTDMQLDSLHWFSQRCSPTPHFWGCAPRVTLWSPNLKSAEIFVPCTYPPSFIILCLLVRKLSRWQTPQQTNKQTPLKTSNFLRYATTLGNKVTEQTKQTTLAEINDHVQTFTALTLPELRHDSRWHSTDFQPKVTPFSNKFTALQKHITYTQYVLHAELQ